LLHLPTNTQVRSHKTRYLEINRRDAESRLVAKLDVVVNGECAKSNVARLRAQERKRTRLKKFLRKQRKNSIL